MGESERSKGCYMPGRAPVHTPIQCSIVGFFVFEVLLTYNIMPISAVWQSDSVLHIYTFFLKIYYSPFWFVPGVEYSSLCYAVRPRCSPSLNNSLHLPTPSPRSICLPPTLPLGIHKSVLCVRDSIPVSRIGSFVPHLRFCL